ncbi:MAG: serine/threonine protein kinase, partial [Myxococcota bacterium]|nr:serine/threonine protein kinase [Myxococcota bacterium]
MRDASQEKGRRFGRIEQTSATMPAMEAGRVLGGKYELVRLIGRGSMGQVWVAHHLTLGEEVALKLLAAPPPLGGEPENPSNSAARFRFEAQVAARLSRKTRHIVRVTDHGEEENGLAYLVMELLEGQTLEELLVHRGAMDPLEVAKLVHQMARALEQAHAESIIHRDLKPANVFVTRDEDGGMLVKLLDFGIARAIRAQRVTSGFSTGEGLIFGTPGYMSPEQACASKLDTRCDQWALATVAYEALTGQLPVGGACTEELLKNLQAGNLVPVHERNPSVPQGLSAFFERAFAPKIDERFGSASELALAFEHAASTPSIAPITRTIPLPIPVRQPLRGETLLAAGAPSRRSFRRRKWARIALVAPAAMLG